MDFLQKLASVGFTVVVRKTPKDLPAVLTERYKNIPTEYLIFLQQFEQITNQDDSAWFNSIENFNDESDSDFKWNDFELQSLDASESDKEETAKVKRFWDKHIPILMAVTEYQYLAICLESDHYGEIVHGIEPEFEDTTKICGNLQQLIILMTNPLENEYLKNFVG